MKIQVPAFEKTGRRLLLKCQKALLNSEATQIGSIGQFQIHEYVGPDPHGKEKLFHMATVDGEAVAVTTWQDKGDYMMSKIFAVKVEYRSTGLIFDMLNFGGVENSDTWYSSGKIATPQMLSVGRLLVQKFTDGTYPDRDMHICMSVADISEDNRISTTEEYDDLVTKTPGAQVFMKTSP